MGSTTDASLLSSLETPEEHVALLRRESAIHEKLRAASIPVVAVGEGWIEGAALGLFLCASERLVTERTHLAMHGCQLGILPSGLSFLAPLVASKPNDDADADADAGTGMRTSTGASESQRAAVAMAWALGGISINAHDAAELQISSTYCQAAELPALLSEMRVAPSEYIDVPLHRHSEPVPECLAHLFGESVVVDAVESIFGPNSGNAADVLATLEDERVKIKALTRSSGWHTRERAETVLEVLEEASSTLGPRCSSPSALAATFAVLRLCWSKGTQADNAAHALAANEHLVARGDFSEALSSVGLNRRPKEARRPAAARIVPRWQPATLDSAALEVASEIEAAWWAA